MTGNPAITIAVSRRIGEEILINIMPRETRVAVLESGVLKELLIERERKRGFVGNIYKGRICRVLPGMEAAFIDIGLERAAFLHVSDIRSVVTEPREFEPAIADLVQEGQELVVQVVKDPLGNKGARVTTHITLASRFLVFLAYSDVSGVSIRIEDVEERRRLRQLLTAFRNDQEGGYIVRTAAEGVDPWAMRADMQFLQRLWESISRHIEETRGISLVYEELPLVLRIMRDFVGDAVERVRIDCSATYERMKNFAGQFLPQMVGRVEYYPGERPIFDLYNIEDEIKKALNKKVLLKSGGYLIIDQTEAMTTIDVNTGAYVGRRNLEETIFKTNLEAVQAIARQICLRNLGGIIIIDFIDMVNVEHQQMVMKALARQLEKDRVRSQICEVSALGLVEMTRKRVRESLEHVLCETCPTCEGRGMVKTVETVCYEIFRELLRESRQYEARKYLVLACQEVVDMMLDEESDMVAELESFIGVPIKLQSEILYGREQYDIVLL